MPLNAANRTEPADDNNLDAQVLLEQLPADRAVKEGWNTEYVRSPTGSTSDMTTVGVQSASLKTFTDGSVPSTTSGFQYNARHVKPGSTAGPFAGWVKARPRSNPGSTGETFPTAPEPTLSIDTFSAFDDGTDIDYTVTWTANSAVDNTFSAEATFMSPSGDIAGTGSEASPASTDTITATDVGAGNGTASTGWHRCHLDLKDSGGAVVDTKTTRTLETV